MNSSQQKATVERNHAPMAAPQRLSSSPPRCLMSGGDGGCGPATWTADEQRWYAELVVQCMAPKQSRAAINVPTVVGQLGAMPLDECIHMRGNATLDGRFKDSADVMWSHDRYGRWFAKVNGQTVWLGCKIARLRYGRAHVPCDLKASHNCGHKDCVRWQHIRFQTKREDVLDREHHELYPGVLRLELRALLEREPELITPMITPNQPARYRSPATSFDLPRPQMSSGDLV